MIRLVSLRVGVDQQILQSQLTIWNQNKNENARLKKKKK